MKEIHISIFNPDNLRLNELYCKLNRYTAKVTADPFEPNMYFHVDGKDIFGEKLELQCLLYDTVITHTFPNMSIENLYVCITIILSLLHLKELNKEEDMICFTLLRINPVNHNNPVYTTLLYIHSVNSGLPFDMFPKP